MTSSESTSTNTSASQQRVVAASDSTVSSTTANNNGRPARIPNVRRRSYADWITRAIQSSAEQKMTLAGIYNWMAANVPGLYEKRNLHSSKGWKNAVRHTLSVNRRFQKSSQPNVRAALWSIASVESEMSISQRPLASNGFSSDLPSCSTLFPSGMIPVTTTYVTTTSPLLSPSVSISTPSCFPSSSNSGNPEPPLDTIVTQTLELHQQDGTVRTVTVPKPFPIHVVGDYRLVTVDPKSHMPHVVTSG